jgi:pantetheine-phosphate adenylyltransferase
MKRIAVFPGSFDPITLGHVDILNRALPLFDKVIVAIGENAAKKSLFTLEDRLTWIRDIFGSQDQVEVDHYEGLTTDYCVRKGAQYLIRGLRSISDFDYERTIAQLNRELEIDVETIFLVSKPAHIHISSTMVREILRHQGNAERFLPGKISQKIINAMEQTYDKQ